MNVSQDQLRYTTTASLSFCCLSRPNIFTNSSVFNPTQRQRTGMKQHNHEARNHNFARSINSSPNFHFLLEPKPVVTDQSRNGEILARSGRDALSCHHTLPSSDPLSLSSQPEHPWQATGASRWEYVRNHLYLPPNIRGFQLVDDQVTEALFFCISSMDRWHDESTPPRHWAVCCINTAQCIYICTLN